MTAANFDYTSKVEALLRKAEGAATPEEAEAFAAKAMQLMAKFGIDQAMIDAAKGAGEKREDIVTARVRIINPYSEAKARMVAWIGMAMRCKTVLHPDAGRRSTGGVTLVGFESDVHRAKMLAESLLVQLSAQVGRQVPGHWDNTPTRTFRKNWTFGFAVAVFNRVEAFEASAVKASASTGSGAELVLVDRKAQVERFYDDTFTNLDKAKKVRLGGRGYGAGVEAGRNADINFGNRVGDRKDAISA